LASTVSTSVRMPAASARSSKLSAIAASPPTYSWNQVWSGAARAMSSIEVLAMVDKAYGMPALAAARAIPMSVPGQARLQRPMGVTPKGMA
jgi:hypothetical protein